MTKKTEVTGTINATAEATETPKKRGRKKKEDVVESVVTPTEETPKRGRKKKTLDEFLQETFGEQSTPSVEETPKKRGRKKKEIAETEASDVNSETSEKVDELTSLYDPDKTKLDLDGLASLSKETKNSMAYVSDNQVRLIIDNYYQTQHHRMNIANQIRAVKQEFDQVQEGEQPAIAWLLKDVENRENQIKKMIAEYVKSEPVCQWAMAIKGIGPVFAANLWSYIDMTKCCHANQFLSYAGLNDNNTPWLGKEKAKDVVDEAFKYFGLKNSDEVNDDVLLRVAVNSGRNLATVKRGFLYHKEKGNASEHDRTHLIAYMAKPPYNTELKKMCYLIGQSFVKVSNRDSLYGRLYKERKALETMKNENGEYAEQAEKLLAEKNYRKDTDTYKFLSEGKLSPAHINQRAQRWAVKIFLTHFFECAWIHTHHTEPPKLYVIEHMGHVDYIEPEVPYSQFVK